MAGVPAAWGCREILSMKRSCYHIMKLVIIKIKCVIENYGKPLLPKGLKLSCKHYASDRNYGISYV